MSHASIPDSGLPNRDLSKEDFERQATRWLVRLESAKPTRRAWSRFEKWLASDPRCREAYRRVEREWHAIREQLRGPHSAGLLDVDRRTRVGKRSHRLAGLACSGLFASVGRRRGLLMLGGVAAAALLVTVGAMWWIFAWRGGALSFYAHSYSTETGKARKIVFADGSVAYLNTQTHLKWIGPASEPRVVLVKGEAFFDVAHRESPWFRVDVDRLEIEDAGTSFDVYRKANGRVVVTVLTGKVNITSRQGVLWKRQLTANQQITYGSGGVPEEIRKVQGSHVVEWRTGEISFQGDRLDTVVEELNRYLRKPIVIADPHLNALRIGGAFHVDNVPGGLLMLQRLYPMTVDSTAQAYILRERAGRSRTDQKVDSAE